jgi:hypothetical protein
MSKKAFSNNPALQFVSGVNHKKILILIQPAHYEKAKKQAETEKVSFNRYIHNVPEKNLLW